MRPSFIHAAAMIATAYAVPLAARPHDGGARPEHAGARGLFISPMGEPFRAGGSAAWFAGVDRDADGALTLAEFSADAARFFAVLDTDHDGELGPEEIDRYETEVVPEVHAGGASGGGAPRGDTGGRGSGGRGGGHQGGHGGGGRGGGRGGGGETGGSSATPGAVPLRGAERYGYLALPEPVIAADTNLDRAVSRGEFLQAAARRFALLDTDQDGVIKRADLPKGL